MNAFTARDLERLLDRHEPPCLSLFMPTHRRPPDTEKDPVVYRNLLRRAAQELVQRMQFSEKDLRDFLAPLEALDEHDFWIGQLDGMAIFRARDCVAVHEVPMPLEENLIIADTFFVRPLLPLLTSGGRFYVLALSQGDVTLYRGNPQGLQALDLPDLPADLQDAVGPTQMERSQNFKWHVIGRGAKFTGHGIGPDDNDPDVERYFRIVDSVIYEQLKDETAPLVLAAPAAHWHLYRKANRYQYLAEAAVDGNFDRTTQELLHADVWPIVAPLLDERRRMLLEQYGSFAGSGRATADLSTIARAAVEGRVLALLLAEGKHLWGRYDRSTGTIKGQVTPDRNAAPGAADVLDDIAEETLRRDGEVYVVPAEELPADAPAAAVFRY